MNLFELYGDDAKYIKHIDEYVHRGTRSKYLNTAFNHLMQKPEYVYTGEMFRAISIPPSVILKTPDVRMMFARMQKYVQKYQHKEVFAWAKKVGNSDEGMMKAVVWQTKLANNMSYFGLIMTQEYEGLDINELFEIDGQHTEWFAVEEEILAKLSNDVNLHGFWLGHKIYTKEQFKEFVIDVRERDDRNRMP